MVSCVAALRDCTYTLIVEADLVYPKIELSFVAPGLKLALWVVLHSITSGWNEAPMRLSPATNSTERVAR